MQQRVVITRHVQQTHRFVMKPELSPGPGLKELLKRANAAGQCEKSVGALGHDAFAFVHGVDDDEFVAASVRPLALDHAFGDHADHLTTGGQASVCHQAH